MFLGGVSGRVEVGADKGDFWVDLVRIDNFG